MQLKSDARVPYKQIIANIESIGTEKEYLENNNCIFSHILKLLDMKDALSALKQNLPSNWYGSLSSVERRRHTSMTSMIMVNASKTRLP